MAGHKYTDKTTQKRTLPAGSPDAKLGHPGLPLLSLYEYKIAMHRLLRIAVIASSAVVLLLLCVAGIVALTAQPNDYKGAITARVQDKFGRTLTIPGDIALNFYPRPGVRVGKAVLSEHGGAGVFATIDSLRLSFALLPLLRGDFVVDRVELRGARATLVRQADGSMNIDDLTAARRKDKPAPPAAAGSSSGGGGGSGGGGSGGSAQQKIGFSVHSIRIDNAHLTYDDRRAGRVIEITRLNMDSGPIEHEVPSRVAMSANVGLSRPDINTAITLTTGFMLDRDKRKLALTALEVNLDLALKEADAHAMARLDGSVDVDLAQDSVDIVLKGKLDDSSIDAKAASHAGQIKLALDIDKLDLGRYTTRRTAPVLPAPAPPGAASGPAAAPEVKIDLSAFSALRASGNLHIGALSAGGIRMTNVNAILRADAGKVALDPVLATLYGGSGKGSLTLDYGAGDGDGKSKSGGLDDAATPRIALTQSLSGISLGPLLRDALGKTHLSGRGEVLLTLRTQGATDRQLRQGMTGTGSLRLADGSVSGFNLAQIVRQVKAGAGTASDAEQTDFSELNASFAVNQGILRSDDLLAKTALLRIGGSGEIDLVREQIDYTIMCTAVPTLEGQGGPEADALKGFTVPVKLSGPLAAISWRVDLKALAAQPAVQALKEKVSTRVKEKLRGLLQR